MFRLPYHLALLFDLLFSCEKLTDDAPHRRLLSRALLGWCKKVAAFLTRCEKLRRSRKGTFCNCPCVCCAVAVAPKMTGFEDERGKLKCLTLQSSPSSCVCVCVNERELSAASEDYIHIKARKVLWDVKKMRLNIGDSESAERTQWSALAVGTPSTQHRWSSVLFQTLDAESVMGC